MMINKNKTLAISFAFITLAIFATPTNAQSNNINGKNEPFQSNERNPFYGDGINPLDIIHNANFFNSRSGSDFAEDTENNINSEAENFKQLQQKRILEMQQQKQNPSQEIETNIQN
ncbi:hypothetical protein [Cyanobacterium sp. Dongsha4]|uniref:hypothetical protein n=1 Tax=Cyanobacterium sp. DS4 TaxID=2878255 RepID=UPI002E814BFC|nr:hypothetical protein [Cyanobacterium sp. Dongsha4]WVL00315.1 hypothetical protein Dongsha4_16930 [Cyanobacterium sp. Dongsha4]